MIQFKLPSLGADMDDGTLVEWKVAPGQAVHKGDVLAIVDTSKAAVDLESWVEGTVHELITQPGQKIPVGTVMAWLLAPGEVAPAAPVAAPAEAAAAAEPAAGRQRVSPVARRRAEALGIDLAQVRGSGPDGAVTLQDVEALAAAPRAGAPAGAATPADRAAGMRRAIATAMSRSKREIPHYYLAESVPMHRALQWLAARNQARPVTERLLPAVLLLKAVALALRKVPELNGHFVDGVFQPAGAVHIGVAISLRQGGLAAPALHDVATQPLDALMPALADLVRRCRAGSLRGSELTDAGITVTNLGDTGVASVFGVIYPPQVALIGFGRIAERPCVVDGAVLALPTVTASLAADHRVSDGHRGAVFLAELRELLQRPEALEAGAP
jgi:pyruvate dehydrogenase E2 component (dihydrolipoamide acetyltransferase)